VPTASQASPLTAMRRHAYCHSHDRHGTPRRRRLHPLRYRGIGMSDHEFMTWIMLGLFLLMVFLFALVVSA
jgi:hypothetical protein